MRDGVFIPRYHPDSRLIAAPGSLQRTNIRVSYNVEKSSVLSILQHFSSGMIFNRSSLSARTTRRLSESIRRTYSFPSSDFTICFCEPLSVRLVWKAWTHSTKCSLVCQWFFWN